MLIETKRHPMISPSQRTDDELIRVSFVIDNLSRAGTETQLLALIRELDRNRVSPSLVILDGDNPLSQSLEPSNCPFLRLGVRHLLRSSTLQSAWRLQKFWREHRPNIVQLYFMDSAYFGVPIAKLSGVKKVVRVRNNLGYWLTRTHRLLNRLIQPLVDVTLTNSTSGRDALIQNDRLSPNQVAVIENGVDLERFANFPAPCSRDSVVRVGCVANLRAVKNIDGFMRAARQVCDRIPNVVFEVVGDGDARHVLEQLHAALRLGDRFILRGSISDVPAFLRSVDVAVLPSHSEGMSNALLEYMAAGRAIVATDVGANTKLIADGRHGLIVFPKDVNALANAIERVATDKALSQQMGRAARAKVETDYSRDAMRIRFEEFYRSLLTRK